MFSQTKRLFTRGARRSGPLVFDPDLVARGVSAEPDAQRWREDLDSLFELVDARMVERRGVGTPPSAADPNAPPHIDRRGQGAGAAASPAPSIEAPADPWFGFGILDQPEPPATGVSPASVDAHPAVDALVAKAVAAGLPEAWKTELRKLVVATVRRAVHDTVQKAVGAAIEKLVHEGVEIDDPDAHVAPAASTRTGQAPSAMVTIRLRRRGHARRSDAPSMSIHPSTRGRLLTR
jgi:hypothetical protein